MEFLGKMAKSLFIFLFLFFSYWTYNYKMEHRKYHVTLSHCHNGVMDGQVTVTVTMCHMTRVT